MAIHALLCATNYVGETCELPDCIDDAMNMAEALEPYIATGKEVIGDKATLLNMSSSLAKLKSQMKSRDLAIVYWSGHGTTDAIGGKNAQGIVTADMQILYEHHLRRLLADLGQAVFIADCCFSGGLVRSDLTTKQLKRQRWIPATHCFHRRGVELPSKAVPKPHATYMACKAGETAASTGKGGAFTLALLEAFAERGDKATLRGLHDAIRKLLPSKEYNQHPQFNCRDAAFAQRTIRSFSRAWDMRARTGNADR